MFLACDLGNTFAKFAIYDNDELVSFFKCHYDQFSGSLFTEQNITKIGISSVVPEMTSKISSALWEKFDLRPFIISPDSLFNLKINYLIPASLGIDRICSAEGAFSLFRSDPLFSAYDEKTCLVTVDMGTATTINIVRYNAEFIGGIIMPGLNTMAQSLFVNTARLPEIDLLNDYKNFVGNDTRSAIASGIINSTSAIIEKSLVQLKYEYEAENVRVYITGGFSGLMEKHLKIEFNVVKDLVLRGVKAVYERNIVD